MQRRQTLVPTARQSNNLLTPTTVGGTRKVGGAGGGISGLVQGIKELEERLSQLEGENSNIDERVEDISDMIDGMRETQLTNTKNAEKAIRECEKVANDMKDMSGGTNNMASFMEHSKKERNKINFKLDKAVNTLGQLEIKVHEEGGQRGNILQQLVKKVALLDRGLSDLNHEVKQTQAFKKQQMKVLVDDVDDLLRNKGDFKQKTDYLFEKI